MKKRKPTGPVRERVLGPGSAGPRAGAAQDGEVTRRVVGEPPGSATGPRPAGSVLKAKRRGRLNPAALAMLGKGLEDCFDEVRKQEVPERFKSLLQRF